MKHNAMLTSIELLSIVGGCSEFGRTNAANQLPATLFDPPVNDLASHGQKGDSKKELRASLC